MRRPAGTTLIFITVTLDMIALGLILPILPKLVVQFTGSISSAAIAVGVFGTAWALMNVFFSPVLGVLSDRFGRRPVLILSNIGLGLDYMIMALAPSLSWLFVGRVISGITSATVPTASAYIADVTPAEKRAKAFGLIGAAFGVGFVIGPAVGGFFGQIDSRLPFWIAGVLSLLNGIFALAFLPESLPREKRASTFVWKRANPFGALALLNSHPQLRRFALANFVGYVGHEAMPTIFVLYVIYRYAWNETTIGLSLTTVGIAAALVSAVLVGRITTWLGERGTLMFGLIVAIVSHVLFGVAANGVLFWIAIPIVCLVSVYAPVMQGLMTAHVSESEQGELQGALGSLRSIAMLAGPMIFPVIFAASIAPRSPIPLPGAAWFLAAVLYAISLVLVARAAPARV